MSLRLQGQRREGIATPHSAPEDVVRYMKKFINRYGTDATHRLEIQIHGDKDPTIDESETGVQGTVIIEIELTGDKTSVR